MYTVNLNQSVLFKLTNQGKELLEREFSAHDYEVTEAGYIRMLLWKFIQFNGRYTVFGIPSIVQHMDIHFEYIYEQK